MTQTQFNIGEFLSGVSVLVLYILVFVAGWYMGRPKVRHALLFSAGLCMLMLMIIGVLTNFFRIDNTVFLMIAYPFGIFAVFVIPLLLLLYLIASLIVRFGAGKAEEDDQQQLNN